MIKGFTVPGSHVDFIEPSINGDFFSRPDEVCRVLASSKAAGINLVKLDLGKGIFPEQCLGHPCLIQRSICLADETLGFVSLDLPVAQQK